MTKDLLTGVAAWLRARWMRVAVLLGVATALGIGGCAQLAEKERELTFRVVPGDASWYGGLPDGVEELDLAVPAGARSERLHAWWWRADAADAPAVLYLHGSRWNLTGQLTRIEQLHDFGFSVLAVDYRGFGRSEKLMPSEDTVYADARVAFDRLAGLQPDPARRYIYGHSLGGAVAIDLAAHLSAGDGPVPARGLIVESTFTTLADIARALSYDWLPVQWIMTQKFDSVTKIAQVRMPVLLAHGDADRYVPARFSRALYDAARAPKRLLLVEGGSHNNSMRLGRDSYRDALHEFFGLRDPEEAAATAPPLVTGAVRR
jgi:alpha-beta hydrolase superfamily lysophospholipase